MAHLRIAIIGASGESGTSIVNGLLEAGNISVVALTRAASINKTKNEALKKRGVEVVAADLAGPEADLVKLLEGIDIVISAIDAWSQLEQIPLATAAKKAGVKRFLPCGLIPIVPAGGVMALRDVKEQVYNHIKKIGLPYTIVDVGWWYEISFPVLPSGKLDYAVTMPFNLLVNDGNTPSALTAKADIGKYFAKIVADERTVNKYVLVYNEVWKPNDTYDLMERLSGEKSERNYQPEEKLLQDRATAVEGLKQDPTNLAFRYGEIINEYKLSWGVRGDNTPEYAKYLGYITSKELYPDLQYQGFEDFLKDVIAGKGKSRNSS